MRQCSEVTPKSGTPEWEAMVLRTRDTIAGQHWSRPPLYADIDAILRIALEGGA